MRRTSKILLLFILIFLLTIIGVKSYTKHVEDKYITEIGNTDISGINRVRCENELILYTEEFSRNYFGYELLVEQSSGFVIETGSYVKLREGTIIISGHGEKSELLKKCSVGDIVQITENTIKITRDLHKSNIKIIEIESEKIDKIIEYKSENLYDIDTEQTKNIDKQIKKKKAEFDLLFYKPNLDISEIDEKIKDIFNLIDQKYYCTIENRAVEARCLWHRPNRSKIDESNINGVREFVNNISALGINTLYVETFWHGMTTYHSDYLDISHPQMANYYYDEYGYDYLKALISECHKEGIEVHAWVELLRVKNPSGEMHDYINPNWIVSDLNGDTSACFLDPSNPDVETFLLNIISEILTNYDFDGISYDYVRYTESGNFNGYQDSGFSQNAEEDFLEQYAYDVDDLPVAVKTDNDIREDWQEFKRSSLSSLIKNISSHIKSINSDVIISVSHYGAIEGAREIYMQDVEFWCENGYIDVILPMIYSTDTFYYTETVKSFNGLNDTVLQYPGIYSLYNGNSIRTTVELIDNSALYSFGNSIFASQNVFTNTDNIIDTLTTTTHKGRAVSPTSDVNAVFDAWKKQISDRTNRIYKNYLTVLEYEIIMEFCQNSSERLNCPQNTADLLKKLEMLRTSVEAIENEAAKARLIEQIDYIYKVLDLSITRSINRQQIIDNQIFH